MTHKTKILILVLLGVSCIEKIDLNLGDSEILLVVEGSINNLDGPNVKLTYATNEFTNEVFFKKPLPVAGARVIIVNETTGESLELEEQENGIFNAPSVNPFLGIENNSYHIEVFKEDDKYVSDSEILKPAIPIDSMYLEFNLATNRMEIFIDMQDPVKEQNFFEWDWVGHREVLTWLAPVEEVACDPSFVECCSQCFLQIKDKEINLFEDRLANGSVLNRVKVGDFAIVKPNGYLIEVRQNNLTEAHYKFKRQLKLQMESEGGLFDPPPYQIQGNIRNAVDGEERVLGYFSAYGTDEKYIQFQGSPFVISQVPWDRLCDDCRDIVGADTLKPKNWKR